MNEKNQLGHTANPPNV